MAKRQETILRDPTYVRLVVRWGTSRSRDNYGDTTCSLSTEGDRVASCQGGGYDMTGTVIGDFLEKFYQQQLLDMLLANPLTKPTLLAVGEQETPHPSTYVKEFYGVRVYRHMRSVRVGGRSGNVWEKKPTQVNGHPVGVFIDGACGLRSMETIIEALGLRLTKVHRSSTVEVYILSKPGHEEA